GGKSTYLRQTALIVILAQMGSFVPARSARLSVVDRVFTRIGASDNLARGRSTFMVEMTETAAILHTATARSLILLDEVGRGTSTYDGLAIAWAAIEYLHARVRAKTLFATHYFELTELAEQLSGVKNYHVSVKETGGGIVFLRKVEPGAADRSYGIEVAKLAGLPNEVITRAREVLTEHESAERELTGHLSPGASPPPTQLTIFTPLSQPVLEKLRAVDLNRLTPLEALNLLAGLKRDPGQLLIVGFDDTEITSRLRSLLTQLQPAGVILFARNIKSPDQTRRLLRDCQKCVSAPLFTCVDLEGGSVDRFRDVLGPAPSAADVFSSGDRSLFRKHGQVIGENCRALGFNVDFAPVLDLAFEASRSVMSSRSVSANPRESVAYAREFLAGLRAAGVLGCGKHFPGLGEGKLDSHHKLPVILKSLNKLWSEDLLPYRMLRAQLPMVMISHATYPAVTHDKTPASLSKKWITGTLRKRIGYRNLIVSDDLEMGAVLSAAPVGNAAVEHIRAGG